MGGLGAFLEPCRAGLAAEAQKCTPEVPKLDQLGGILEVRLELKSQKIDPKFVKFWVVFRSSLGGESASKITAKMEAEIDSKTLSKELGSESSGSVISNNPPAF